MDTRCALAVATATLAAAAGCTASSEGTTAVRAAAPPAYIPPVVRSTDLHWPFWEKSGMVVRAGSRPIDVSVPANWRGRAAITWGNGLPAASAIRFTPCPSPAGVWNAYAGGFLL